MYHRSNSRPVIIAIVLIAMIFLPGCFGVSKTTTPALMPGLLTPYLTVTSDLRPTATSVVQTETLEPVLSTLMPTPVVYTVMADDTLIGIAERYSIESEELLAANPGIDPDFLSVGLTLTIPLSGEVAAVLPSPTPLPVEAISETCHPQLLGKIHCMVVVENKNPYDLENVSVLITIVDPSGNEIAESSAYSPVYLLPAGMRVVLGSVFAVPEADLVYLPQVKVLTAYPTATNLDRYSDTDVDFEVSRSDDGRSATIRGWISLKPGEPDVSQVWVAASGYDASGQGVGYRKWISDEGLTGSESLPFEFVIYAMGAGIETVELIVETSP